MSDTLLRVIIIERLSKAIVYTSMLAGHVPPLVQR